MAHAASCAIGAEVSVPFEALIQVGRYFAEGQQRQSQEQELRHFWGPDERAPGQGGYI